MTTTNIEITLKAHCNKCLGWKNHLVAYSEDTRWSDELDGSGGMYIDGGDEWTLLKCRGCDAIRLRHRHWFSEICDEHGRPIINEEFFPPTISRQKPLWRRHFLSLGQYLQNYNALSDEIYEALASGSNQLATMGIRALVERLMVDQVGDQGSFEKNIQTFFNAGHVAPNQQMIFRETLVEAGHAAMHRSFEPSVDTVNTLLDILEGIMHTIYFAPKLAEQVNKTIPPRTKKPQANNKSDS